MMPAAVTRCRAFAFPCRIERVLLYAPVPRCLTALASARLRFRDGPALLSASIPRPPPLGFAFRFNACAFGLQGFLLRLRTALRLRRSRLLRSARLGHRFGSRSAFLLAACCWLRFRLEACFAFSRLSGPCRAQLIRELASPRPVASRASSMRVRWQRCGFARSFQPGAPSPRAERDPRGVGDRFGTRATPWRRSPVRRLYARARRQRAAFRFRRSFDSEEGRRGVAAAFRAQPHQRRPVPVVPPFTRGGRSPSRRAAVLLPPNQLRTRIARNSLLTRISSPLRLLAVSGRARRSFTSLLRAGLIGIESRSRISGNTTGQPSAHRRMMSRQPPPQLLKTRSLRVRAVLQWFVVGASVRCCSALPASRRLLPRPRGSCCGGRHPPPQEPSARTDRATGAPLGLCSAFSMSSHARPMKEVTLAKDTPARPSASLLPSPGGMSASMCPQQVSNAGRSCDAPDPGIRRARSIRG